MFLFAPFAKQPKYRLIQNSAVALRTINISKENVFTEHRNFTVRIIFDTSFCLWINYLAQFFQFSLEVIRTPIDTFKIGSVATAVAFIEFLSNQTVVETLFNSNTAVALFFASAITIAFP
jgi:hypothetical protein